MKAATILTITILLLFSARSPAQNPWWDSVRKVAAAPKSDTGKVRALIALCDLDAFSYPDSAFAFGKQANELSEKLDYDKGRLYSIISLNSALYCMGNYPLELDYAFRLLPLSKRMGDINATGFSFGAVGDSYLNLGEYQIALRYYKEVLKLGIREKLPELHRMYSLMAPVFIGLQQYDSALYYAKKGYAMFRESAYYASNDWDMQWSQSCVYVTLGQALEGKKIYDSALYYYRLSLPVSGALNMRMNSLLAYGGMAAVFAQQHDFDSAKYYARKVLSETRTSMYPLGKQKAADLLASVYEQQHDADSSLKYLHLAMQVKDSLYDHQKMMAFQEVIFRENEKQHEIESATRALQNEYRLYLVIGGLMAVFAVVFILIRKKRQEQLQAIRNSIADDLHDDIGSALSSISIMSELAKAKSPGALPLLASIGESTAVIQENMSDIIWAMKTGNDRFGYVLQRMQLFASEILDAKNMELEFSSDGSLAALRLTMGQRKNLYLLFKEAVNNAAKHSCAKKVSVSIDQKNHFVEMDIRDDGKGFDASKTFKGNGMCSLKKRAAELHGDLKIVSQPNEGTAVILRFRAQ